MNIMLINGSPKQKDSTSGVLLEKVKHSIRGRARIIEVSLHTKELPINFTEIWKQQDVCIIAFPLYVDAIPGHLLSCLTQIEKIILQANSQIVVYGIVNNGFYEGIQAEIALQILENWCIHAGLLWNGGIGIGGGGAIASLPRSGGPLTPVNTAIEALSENVLTKKAKENCYVNMGMPRFLYKIVAQLGWRQMICAKGGRPKDLGKTW